MGSAISFHEYGGGNQGGDKAELICFCKDSPVEVLKKVFREYAIYSYKGIMSPIYPEDNLQGLVIVKGVPPQGTIITGKFRKVNLSEIPREKKERTEEDKFRKALAEAIKQYLSPTWPLKGSRQGEYLYTRSKERQRDFERNLGTLLEVAEITLGIRDVKGLKNILESI